MTLTGNAWKLGNNVATDQIAPVKYFHLKSDLPELAKHILEEVAPEVTANIKQGDFLVAGTEFGEGSIRDNAAKVIKLAGVSAVFARSFAKPFFKNAINIGLPVIVCNTDKINANDSLNVDLSKGIIKNETTGKEIIFNALPDSIIDILNDGGLADHIEKHGYLNH